MNGQHGQAIVVCGPPGSGKTTYVQERRKPGDIVWDWDAVAAAMLGDSDGGKGDLAGLAKHMRTALVGWCSAFNRERCVWVIVTDRAQARLVSEQLKGRLVVLDVDAEECRRRVIARGGDVSSRMKAIDEWK